MSRFRSLTSTTGKVTSMRRMPLLAGWQEKMRTLTTRTEHFALERHPMIVFRDLLPPAGKRGINRPERRSKAFSYADE